MVYEETSVANITQNLKQIEIPGQFNTNTSTVTFKPPQPIDTHPTYANNGRSPYQQNSTRNLQNQLQQNQNQNQMYLINLNPAINQIELLQIYRQKCGDVRSSHFIISSATNQIIGLLDFSTPQGLKAAFQIQEFSGYPLICVDASTFSNFPTVASPPPAPASSMPHSTFAPVLEKEPIPANKMLAMKNLPFDITNEKLTYEMEQRDIFIRPSKIIYHQQNNKFSGILFVDFETQEDATYVYEHLQQWYVGGRNITVEYKLKSNMATPRTPGSSYYNTPSHGYQNKNYTPRHPNVNHTPRNNLYLQKTPNSLNRSSSTGHYTPRQPQVYTQSVSIGDDSVMDNLVNKISQLEKNGQSYARGPDGSKGFGEQPNTAVTVENAPARSM